MSNVLRGDDKMGGVDVDGRVAATLFVFMLIVLLL